MKVAQYLCLSIICMIGACSKAQHSTSANNNLVASKFAKGADVSWVTEMENAGYKFYNNQGQPEECMQLLKDKGINSIRLRAWVNPVAGWCNTRDLATKALRAKSLGLRIMIDFHYSDFWADPGKQNKPAAWLQLSSDSLLKTVYNYTWHVMDTLNSNGIYTEWAQVGNETNDGMLWEDGRASTNMPYFAQLINAGYDAIKKVSDSTKVIVHISNGYDNALFRWIFDGLQSNGAKWDVIGMSLYPDTTNWQTLNNQCLANMNDMLNRYNKEIMICEVGMNVSDSLACKSFLSDIIVKTKSITNNKGLGVFYWEPECYNWKGYPKGAFDSTGKPTVAVDGFVN
jgi:arabinogalactan endo-1,4-beta-galactosidase